MGIGFKVALVGSASSEVRARCETLFGDALVDEDAADLCIYIDTVSAKASGLPHRAGVLLCNDTDSDAATDALAGGKVQAIANNDDALDVACRRAWTLYLQLSGLQIEARRSWRYADAIASLSRLGSELAEVESRKHILRRMSESSCFLSGASLCALLLVDRREVPIMHIHSEQAWDKDRLLSAQGHTIDAYMRMTGRSVDQRQLQPQISGRPLGTQTTTNASLAEWVELPLLAGSLPIGIMRVGFARESAPDEFSERILELSAAKTTEALAYLQGKRFEQRRRLGLMVESMADGLIMTELERDEVLINPAARRLLDIPSGTQVTQQYLKERLGFYPFDLVAANPESSELLREELSVGDKRLHSMVSPVRERSGSLIGVVVVLRDFTEAQALAHRQEEFVAIVSHELRSPLTSISGALDIALSDYAGKLNPKQREYLSLARQSCTQLNQIVDDLLDVARSDSTGMPIDIGNIDLVALTKLAVDKYRSAAGNKQIRLELKMPAGDLPIPGDPDRLTQVLNNLLSNALKFTPIKGLVEVEVFGPSVSSSHVGVSVFNNGETIDEEARERIFEKFEQAKDSSTRRVGGSGLGLAISRSIVEAHGGRIWVETGDLGAKFVFTLPSDAGVPEVPVPEAESTPTPRSGKTVVLVDADRHSSYILKGILMQDGHDVFVAKDPDSALTEARKRLPPLIVVRDSEELGDAVALIEILKHDADTRRSAILALTEHEDDAALRAATGNLMQLPVSPEPFHTECARLIQEAGAAHGSRVLVVDDDDAIRKICVGVLKHAGMTVREAANGIAAISETKRFRPDLLLLDIMMPDLDGFATAEHLKADPASAMTPIIFLSAMGETADKVRAFQIGAEDYIVKPFVAAELVARVRKALERSHRELGASPTTQLPGGGAIEAEIQERLGERDAAFCYLDLDNLKAYNDYYSYAKADSIIRQTGDLVREVVSRLGSGGDFVGHIAGDDFVFITTREYVDDICTTLCSAFDRLVPLYYDRKDREAGFIEAKDRYDEMRRFPLMSVSVAAVTNESLRFASYTDLAKAAAIGKGMAKGVEGSCYVRDGETVWSARGRDATLAEGH